MAGIFNTRHSILTDVPRVLFTGSKRITVTANTTSFSVSGGTPTPSSISLTATLFGLDGTINWTVPYGTATLSSSTGASVSLVYGSMVSKVVTVRASITVMGVTYTSDVTLTKTEDGVNGTRTAVLDVYQWATAAPSSFPVGNSVYTWATGQFTAPSNLNGWSLTPTAAVTGQTLWIARTVFADSLTTTTSTITWSATAAIPTGASGVNGQRVGLLEVYRWSASSPVTYPSGTSVYTWATGAFTDPSTANGWSVTPSAPLAGQTLWGISTVVSDNLTTATSTATWSSTTVYPTGAAGINGTRTAILDMYKVSATTPNTFPAGSSTYTWLTGQFTDPATLNGWSRTPPASVLGQTLWIARTVFADNLTTLDSNITWTANTALSLGASGSNGSRTAFMEVYRWSTAAPDTFPVGDSVYTWLTGAFTSPSVYLNGWSLSPPAPVLGQTLWACSMKYIDSLTTLTSTIAWTTNVAYPVGAAGNNAKSLSLTADTQVFQIAKTGLVNGVAAGAAAVTFTSVSQNLTGSPPLDFNVISGTGSLSGTGNTRTLFYSSMGASDTVVVEVTGDGLSDKMTIVKVREGSDAVVAYLTNDSANLPASDAGVVSSYTAATGTFKVRRGSEDVTTSCSFSVITNTDGLTTSINASTGVYSVTAGFPIGSDTTSVTYQAVYTYAGQTYTIPQVFSLSKARAGAVGVTGAAVDIVFRRQATQPATPTATYNPPTVFPITWYTNVNSVPASADPMWSSVGRLAAGSASWVWETPIKIEGTDGTDANVVSEVAVYSQSFSAPLTPTGGTYSFGSNSFTTLPTGADLMVWEGSMPTVAALPIYESRSIASAPVGGSDSTLTWSSPVKIYENADDGVDAKLMSASVTSQVFQINKAGVATPATITLKAIRNNITGATWSVVPLSGTATLRNATDTGAYVSGDVALLKYGNMDTDSVTFKVVDDTVPTPYEDTITIVKVREGSDALVGYLTNENVTLPAQTDGTVVSYTGASGNFIVMLGAADVTAYCNFAVEENTSSLTPVNNIVTSGTNAGQYAVTGGFTTDTAEIVYKATYSFLGNLYTVYKKFTLSKSKTGTTGAVGSAGSSARIAYVKLVTNDTPSLSPTPSTYTWTGDVLPQLDNPSPTTGRWGEVNAWLTYPPSITVGEQVWQSTGVYNYLTNETTWVSPYLSNLKVGSLAAITVNTGTLTVDASGYVRGGQTGYNTGTGFWLGYDGGAYKFSIGNATQSLTWNGSALTLKGNLQVNTASVSGTTMTGSGAQFNATGTFALGTAANNITYNGTDLTMNGTVNLTDTLTFRRSANSYLALGQTASSVVASHGDAGAQALVGLVSAGASAKGVYGFSSNAASYGVYGESATGVGVFGLTTSNKALQGVSVTSAGYSAHLNGKVGLTTAYSPLELNASQGTTGQTLISQGTGNTPAWGNRVAGGAVTTDGSGNATISVVMGSSTFGFSGTTTSGAIVTISSVTNTGGDNYDVVIQTQYCTTGAAYPSRGVRWTAIG